MMGMASGMSGSTGMGGMGGMASGMGGHNFWQARQMSASGVPHMGYASGHGHQQHDAKMAEKIVTELQVRGLILRVSRNIKGSEPLHLVWPVP